MQKTLTVELDMYDFDTSEIIEVLESRGLSVYQNIDETKHLLRHGIEDRDWSKIEEFAEKLDVEFSKTLSMRNKK